MNHHDIEKAISRACEICGVPELANRITIRFSRKMTRTAGTANCKTNELTFSVPYWDRADQEDVRNTVYHEVCHLITHYKWSKLSSYTAINWRPKPHGPAWKMNMLLCGEKPTRTHQVDMGPSKRRQLYVVYCGCGEIKMGPVQHRRAASGQKKYRCITCGQQVRLTNDRSLV